MTDKKSTTPPSGVEKPKASVAPPMMKSERTELLNKIRQLQEDTQLTQTATLHRVTRTINLCEFLNEEDKTELIRRIWK